MVSANWLMELASTEIICPSHTITKPAMPAGRCLGWRTAVGSGFLFTHRFPIAGGGRAGRAPAHAGAQYHTCAAGCRLAQAALLILKRLQRIGAVNYQGSCAHPAAWAQPNFSGYNQRGYK